MSSVVIFRRSLRSSSSIESDIRALDLTLWRKAVPPPIAPAAATIRPPKAIKLVGLVIGKITGLEVVAVGVVIVAWTLEATSIDTEEGSRVQAWSGVYDGVIEDR
jgi:hypothetical protein